jgi:hypothetical protein
LTINDLQAAGRLNDPVPVPQSDGRGKTAAAAERVKPIKARKYAGLDLIPVEIAMQRGYFTYFVENREEVFEDAYGQSLRLLLERDENDAHRPLTVVAQSGGGAFSHPVHRQHQGRHPRLGQRRSTTDQVTRALLVLRSRRTPTLRATWRIARWRVRARRRHRSNPASSRHPPRTP